MIKKIVKGVIFAILIFSVVYVMCMNVFVWKNNDFWNTSFTSCITLIVALVVSYYYAQKNLDERRQKESYLKLLEKVQRLVSDKDLIEIKTKEDIEIVLMKKRELNNYMCILKKYAKKFSLQKDIDFIEGKVKEYAELFGDHQHDIGYLKNNSNDLSRPLLLIDSRISEVMIKLFD